MDAAIALQPLELNNASHIETVAELWSAACGQDLAISPRFAGDNMRPAPGAVQTGRLARQNDRPIAFVLASTLPNDPVAASPEQGWIDALAVHPDAQRQGIGAALMRWAESWLGERGCRRFSLGASLHTFVPGVPAELQTEPFFQRLGYGQNDETRGVVWDMASDLATYTSPSSVHEIDGVVQPGQPGQEQALLTFLRREFPNRWRYELEEFLLDQDRFSDYMLLWTSRGVDGFCQLTFPDSRRSLERYYPYRLPRPWGQLGTIGVSADRRGIGYGAAVLDAGLRRLQANGIRGCVIDWTGLVDFYGKFGFHKYREYISMQKTL